MFRAYGKEIRGEANFRIGNFHSAFTGYASRLARKSLRVSAFKIILRPHEQLTLHHAMSRISFSDTMASQFGSPANSQR
jgi:hypothetical protein